MKEYPDKVLVFFQFTNPELVPFGARFVERNEAKICEKRLANGVKVGEHGEGDQVTIKLFVSQLIKSGYTITNTHYYKKGANGDGSSIRYVLVVTFSSKSGKVRPNDQTLKILDQLIYKDAWTHFHCWRNVNGVMSVHCLHRIPNKANDDRVGEFMFIDEEDENDQFLKEAVV